MGSQDWDATLLGLTVAKTSSRHKRSKSFPDKRRVHESNCVDSIEEYPRLKLDTGTLKAASESKKKVSPNSETRDCLKQEIIQLEKRLQEQFVVRHTLETALGSRSSSSGTDQISMPKPATELIKEIAVLELEVMHLEQYLLSLYRKAFDQQTSSVSPTISVHQKPKSPVMTPRRLSPDNTVGDTTTKFHSAKAHSSSKLLPVSQQDTNALGPVWLGMEERMSDFGVDRCHSTFSHVSTYPMQSSLTMDPMSSAYRSCHSQPLSTWEYAQNTASNVVSLADHLGPRISDHIPETPNRISEEMVKLMATIFSKLAEPSSAHNSLSSPNTSSSSSTGAFPQNYQLESWSSSCGKDSSLDIPLDNPFNVKGLKEFSGPFSALVEVSCIYRGSQKLCEVELLLQNFRSLICRLQEIHPKKMTHEEKLAFWINIHNALMMHAILAYGIPQNNMKKVVLLLKATYNVGGRTISADTIQNTILGCRMSRPGQWIRMIISPSTKFKLGVVRQAFAIEHPEPLLHFALCSGSHSDPALRVYTPKRVFQELEAAKEEFLRANFGFQKDQKLVLPKLVESYAKDAALCTSEIVETIQKSLPDSYWKSLKKCQTRKSKNNIEWVPSNSSFRYVFHRELVK